MIETPRLHVLTIGTFDLFHTGHVRFLEQCAKLGRVTVAVNRDGFVEKFKGQKPVIALPDRIDVVAACRFVDRTCINIGDEDAQKVILQESPNILAIGTDWVNKDYMGQLGTNLGWLKSNHVALVYLPYSPIITSTEIRQRLLSQQSSSVTLMSTKSDDPTLS